jgi:hypothetical protein
MCGVNIYTLAEFCKPARTGLAPEDQFARVREA